MPDIEGPYPAVPALSLRSNRAPYNYDLERTQQAGPSKSRLPLATSSTTAQQQSHPASPHPLTNSIRADSMYTPPSESRLRSAKIDRSRRPHSAYPPTDEPVYHVQRKYTDPTPHSGAYLGMEQPPSPMPSGSNPQLDVDLDVYSQDYSELDDDMRQLGDDMREPTLSFATTSTVDSTASSPSIGEAYTYGTERVLDGKPEHEPRIRMRTGRQNAYSSAESSMASGAFSYHAYSEYNQQPPVPPLPADLSMGLNRNGYRVSTNETNSTASYHATSPSSSYVQRQPWRSPVMARDRSLSVSTTDETEESSGSGEERLSSAFEHSFSYLSGSLPARQPWEDDSEILAEPNALAMVDDGRGAILNQEKLEAMGGVRVLSAMSDNDLLRLPRFTHLLLAGVGPSILDALPALLDVLSTTLVVLDISNNDLTTLPTALRHCSSLEELNISHNPLLQLPSLLGECTSLRMLVADGCLLSNLPVELAQTRSLHTLCVRGNRLVTLPPWLCLLGHLETLRIDNNPFAAQWQPIVAPILASTLRSGNHSRSSSAASNYARPGTTQSNYRPTTAGLNSAMSSLNASQTSVGGPSSSADSLGLGLQNGRTQSVPQSLRTTTRAAAKQDSPMRAPNRSISNPNPHSEILSDRTSAPSNRRVFSAAHYTDESEAEGSEKNSKWGFLRKVSLSRLRTEKDRSAQMSASAAANISSMPSGPVISAPTLIGGPPKRPPLSADHWSTGMIPTRPRGASQSSADLAVPSASTMSVPKLPVNAYGSASGGARSKRRSFLPIDPSPPSLNVAIPSMSPFMAPQATLADGEHPHALADDAVETLGDNEGLYLGRHTPSTHHAYARSVDNLSINEHDGRYSRGLDSIKSYLRDLYDLSLPPGDPYGAFEVIQSQASTVGSDTLSPLGDNAKLRDSVAESTTTSARHLTISSAIPSRSVSMVSVGSERHSAYSSTGALDPDVQKRYKDDPSKRTRVLHEIFETEKTYVRGLDELVQIYVRPASLAAGSSKGETVIPMAERKVVFGGVESILIFHRDNFLPALERALDPLLQKGDDASGAVSALAAHKVGEEFRNYIAYMKQYSTYINNFDNALSRMKTWLLQSNGSSTPSPAKGAGAIGVAAVGASLVGSAVLPVGESVPQSGASLTPAQRKRVKTFLKRAKENPKHSQINLESYLLLPVQRIPRYKLLLSDLALCTPPRESIGPNDALDDAIHEITTLASLMNEEKREAESRLRLLAWQQRITSRGPSPLVQPHRKLILDGALTLIRVVKKASAYAEVDGPPQLSGVDGDSTITGNKTVVPVEFIKPEPMEKPIMLILCSDMLVLVQQRPGEGWEGSVDLFSVLRMATVREPASVSASNDRVLRVVDNRSIYYFNGGTHATTLQWCRAINGQNSR
ncbi:hypothetical protein CC85DRAFT_261873 [Cutaneotrichosporon oleaginosum]|uniref:DH domain-containing protein n=1 Tax=Cutaneotrichosporon oleaginosum TaxID=879819 RepID=A0A0J0XKG8_9TREE|nr:uncharacterized protein CC85DRAFT_261873 [Cutaneotrichosporon oleaginosum]KLT41596.1 hypothetical protein CC85DRAFT_261873 [Cutaneotrichosporon oleaginosum]TXT09362.1 hypothetical protein COLE_03296 [Cutaneotrichosporon oleaginosum]